MERVERLRFEYAVYRLNMSNQLEAVLTAILHSDDIVEMVLLEFAARHLDSDEFAAIVKEYQVEEEWKQFLEQVKQNG